MKLFGLLFKITLKKKFPRHSELMFLSLERLYFHCASAVMSAQILFYGEPLTRLKFWCDFFTCWNYVTSYFQKSLKIALLFCAQFIWFGENFDYMELYCYLEIKALFSVVSIWPVLSVFKCTSPWALHNSRSSITVVCEFFSRGIYWKEHNTTRRRRKRSCKNCAQGEQATEFFPDMSRINLSPLKGSIITAHCVLCRGEFETPKKSAPPCWLWWWWYIEVVV